ncbi:MAG: hypothetical protein LBM08_06795 [Dysgonamonadaceae bacterium]|nr:hypothetical protein [Dysgonamonadaceae bacterium]
MTWNFDSSTGMLTIGGTGQYPVLFCRCPAGIGRPNPYGNQRYACRANRAGESQVYDIEMVRYYKAFFDTLVYTFYNRKTEVC